MYPGKMPLRPQAYNGNDHEFARVHPVMVSYRQNQPGVMSLEERVHNQADPGGSESRLLRRHGKSNPVQSEYNTDQVLRPPRGQSVINRKSNFAEVKHVVPPTLPEALGQSDTVSWAPQGLTKPLSFVPNKHDFAVDESVPNRHSVFVSGLPLPRSRGRGPYQRGLTGYGQQRAVPVIRSSLSADKGGVAAMSQRPVSVMKKFRPPSWNVKQFVRGNPFY